VSNLQPGSNDRIKRTLARLGRSIFGYRLEIGLGVTALAIPFVRPTVAKKPEEVRLKAFGLCLVLVGLGVRAWAAAFAGRHTRSSEIQGDQLATAGPYAHVRNPIYLGSIILGFGMVLMIGDRRLLTLCLLTFLSLYFGLIPAEEEFLSQKFREEYERYCRNVPRLLPRLTPWPESVKKPFDGCAASGEGRLSLILLAILGVFRVVAAVRGIGRAKSKFRGGRGSIHPLPYKGTFHYSESNF
jgi:protein-S-isoprenylcysteine O-methyltransferase Ste14